MQIEARLPISLLPAVDQKLAGGLLKGEHRLRHVTCTSYVVTLCDTQRLAAYMACNG